MSGAAVKTEPVEKHPRAKGPWMRDVEKKLLEAIDIGVRSSGKAETREHRVRFYTEELTRAKLEVEFYEEMLRLEEEQERIPSRYDRECTSLEEELRVLQLRGRVLEARERVGVSGHERDADSDTVRTEATFEGKEENQW